MARCILRKEEFNKTIQEFCNDLKKLEKGGSIRVDLGTDITYSDMECLSSSLSLTPFGCKGEDSECLDR